LTEKVHSTGSGTGAIEIASAAGEIAQIPRPPPFKWRQFSATYRDVFEVAA